MPPLHIIILCVLLLYMLLLLYAAISFSGAPLFSYDPAKKNHTTVCVVICARNEELTIGQCLCSVLEQDFDRELLEIVVVNDASADATAVIAEELLQGSGARYRIISNAVQEGKKRSITKALEQCSSRLIVTRDADTFTTSKSWLGCIVSFHEQSGREFIIAPVDLLQSSSFIAQLQAFENDALAMVTAGFALAKHPFLCNGANLAFTKELFAGVNGYAAHGHIASGDDVLLLADVKRLQPGTIVYLKHPGAIVYTYPQRHIGELLRQKIRWASKFSHTPGALNRILALSVFSVHVFTLFFLSKALFTGHLHAFGLFFIFSRFFIDFLLLFLASRYYKKPVSWPWIVPAWIAYSFFVLIPGVLSWFYKPKWK